MTPEDSELIQQFQKGDTAAFEILVRRYERPLFTFLLRLTRDRHKAEDLFQDTFLRILKALPGYQEKGKFSNWLFRIANSVVIDAGRKDQVRRRNFLNDEQKVYEAEGHAEPPDRAVERSELLNQVEEALASLPEKQRRVFLLRQHGDLRFKEIAEILDQPLNTVLSQMRYAVAKLRNTLSVEKES